MHGRFTPGKGITLYTAAIAADAAADGCDCAAYYQSVLVHEYAHALHFAHILARFDACCRDVTSTAYQSALRYWYGGRTQALQARTVKETLAEFTRYLWCCENGWKPLAQAVTQALTGARAYYPGYPYAGCGRCAHCTRLTRSRHWSNMPRCMLLRCKAGSRRMRCSSK